MPLFKVSPTKPNEHDVYLDAPSWYDAREYARGRYPGRPVSPHWLNGTTTDAIVVGSTHPTAHDKAVEYAEAIYAQGYRDGLAAREE